MKEESNKETILVRVVKGNYKNKKTLFLSEPMTISDAMDLIKEIVPTLPSRGEGTLLVKFVEDKGIDFDYMSCGGWLIFSHSETVPW